MQQGLINQAKIRKSFINGSCSVFACLCLNQILVKAQDIQVADSLQKHYQKSYFILHGIGGTALYAGFYSLWYSDYNYGRFQLFNDNLEWMGLDKCGHVYSNFQVTSILSKQYYFAGFPKRKACLIGWGISNAYFLGIEIMDGFSKGWGFSYGDILANVMGSTLAAIQYWLWQEPIVNLKFYYAPSPYPKYRPDLLGNSFPSKLIKDYNAQTYWLATNPWSILPHVPSWLSAIQVAFGYGANGMIAAEPSKQQLFGYKHLTRYRQYFFSLDLDWTKLPFQNSKLKSFCKYLNVIKLPLPYLAIEQNKTNLYWWPKY